MDLLYIPHCFLWQFDIKGSDILLHHGQMMRTTSLNPMRTKYINTTHDNNNNNMQCYNDIQ
jgi:hypothetical protein